MMVVSVGKKKMSIYFGEKILLLKIPLVAIFGKNLIYRRENVHLTF